MVSRGRAQGVRDQDAEGRAQPLPRLRENIKLVVWDLDDTLWSGTLSEEEVVCDSERAEIVRTLNRRGIVNSICSKNDFDAARARLQLEGLWEEFVFPSIDWTPKGTRIREIVESMQLRPANVLFVDDQLSNLQEALHYLPELQVALPEEILPQLLELPQAAGKEDPGLTRLAQYRLLERKYSDRERQQSSNEEFLRGCDICVEVGIPTAGDAARVIELVNRSNQLNFTSSRITRERYDELLSRHADAGWVRVRDRYGDYGLCGFYSLQNGALKDFVFSCRIMNMGVEQWLYERLGRPQLEIAGEAASELRDFGRVDWINSGEASAPAQTRPVARRAASRILLKGGCDLFMLNGFLGGAIKTEFTYNSTSGSEVHSDHTEVLRRSRREVVAEHGAAIEQLPFLDRAAFGSLIVRRPRSFGTLIFSVLMDYTQGLYRLRGSDFVVGYGQLDVDATDPANWEALARRWRRVGIDEPFLRWFSERFEFAGGIAPERFQQNIRWLRDVLPSSTRMILLNGAEVAGVSEKEPDRDLRHAVMNRALEEVAGELDGVEIFDVRPLVNSPADFTDNIRHYTRRTYLLMAEGLREMCEGQLAVTQHPTLMRLHRAQRRLARTLERATARHALR